MGNDFIALRWAFPVIAGMVKNDLSCLKISHSNDCISTIRSDK